MNESQKAFEDWSQLGSEPLDLHAMENGYYISERSNDVWLGWQASRADLIAKLESDEIVERVARELALLHGDSPDYLVHRLPLWEKHIGPAKDLIVVIVKGLK